MSQIIIQPNNTCKIIDPEASVEFYRALDLELSFKVQGAQHTQAFKGYVDGFGQSVRWDGQQHLLSDSLEFKYGLLERVKTFYGAQLRDIEVIDQRAVKTDPRAINIASKLDVLGKKPHYYQIDALNAALNTDCGILKLSTGAGKTIITVMISATLGKTTIVYVIGKGLLYQMYDLYKSIFDCEIGIIGDGKCVIGDITIATVWTVSQALGVKAAKSEDEANEKKIEPEKYKQIRDLLKNTKVHLFDECHLAASETIQSIYRSINPEHIYGLSGTPFRDDGADLLIEAVLGKYIIDISATRLINEGYLVQPFIKFIKVPKVGNVGQKYQTIYRNYIINNEIRNSYVAKGAESLVKQGYPTLVLFNSIEHGKILNDLISPNVSCLLLSGKDHAKIREEAKNKLESGEIKCIIASKIFDLGIDLPTLSGLVLAGSGKSSVRCLQRIGRVIRKGGPSKTKAVVIDFLDQAKYLESHSNIRKNIYEMEEGFKLI